MKNKYNTPRRDFLKMAAAGTAGLAVLRPQELLASPMALAKGPGNKWEGRVVVNFNKAAVTGTQTVNEQVVKTMVGDAIKLLTNEATVGSAWKAIFPAALTAQSKIAIKINILNNGLPVAQGLQQMDFSGTKFPAANITLYDMNNGNTMDSAGFTAARFPNVYRVKDTAQAFGDGAMNNRSYARSLNACQFLINVFSPRGQGSDVENFTLGFKSHFGTYSNPQGLHGAPALGALRDFNCTGPVYQKLVLSMCSGLFGMNESNGPTGDAANYSTYAKTMDPSVTTQAATTIIMSTDPVSAEMQAIKMMRLNKSPAGLYTVAALPAYLRASAGVSGTLTPVYIIGIIDESKMDVRRIINGTAITTERHGRSMQGKPSRDGLVIQRIPNAGVFVEYTLTDATGAETAHVEIRNSRGALVRTLSDQIHGCRNQLAWDERTDAGTRVPGGVYAVHLAVGGRRLVGRVTII
jgi:hypothetical protein